MPRLLLCLLIVSLLSACGGSGEKRANPDIDGDGVVNELDAFPQDARESADSDGDGVGDNSDDFPDNASETVDTDGDGVGDNSDAFPNDINETLDSDGDRVGDNSDVFPNDSSENSDTDGDGVGDNSDDYPLDFDNDSVPDAVDLFPKDPTESSDTDGDGIGDNSDPVFDVNYEHIGLGNGVGSGFQDGVALTGLSEGERLSATGSTTVQVSIVNKRNENTRYPNPVDVYFTSSCTQAGLAEFKPDKVLASGMATTTYIDKGCGGAHGNTDNIVVYIVTESDEGILDFYSSAIASIEVGPTEVGAIEFVQAAPSVIALAGFGNAEVPSISRLEFRVLDNKGNPIPGYLVNFELDHEYGGTQLSVVHAITDQEGMVQTVLNGGNFAVPVRVKASVDITDENGNPRITMTTLSAPITMATPLARPNGIILSADTYNPHAWDYTGTEVVITAQVSDNNQNPVMDGTQIHFSETAGLVDSHCETLQGSCSVTWRSVNPNTVDGYATIMAQARGQGNFQDRNSNGLFDIGESFQAYGEAWFDANGNGVYESEGRYQADLDIDNDGINEFDWNPEGYQVYVNADGDYTEAPNNFYEEMVDTNNNGELDSIPDAKYQGINCSDAAIADGHCAELIDVTASLKLQMSAGNDVYIEGPFLKAENGEYDYSQTVNCIDGQTNSHQVAWRVSDSQERRNHLPVGSVISYVGSSAAVISENGFGEVQSLQPPLVLPVWEVQAANIGLTGSERKHKYLNEKAHLVELRVSKPESVDPESTHGTFTLNVRPMDESIYVGFNQMLTIGYGSAYCAPPILELEL